MEFSKKIVRIFTSGSVDDGKSTLIGRLLYDTNSLYPDQIESVEDLSQKRGFVGIDFSLFTDGLIDERSQGITIDVAYRYFSTPSTKYIIADNPGHIQYTRNMVSGSSDADVAIVLIDANKGFNEQVIRHTFIAFLFRVPLVVFCINKMDRVQFNKEVFLKIQQSFLKIKENLPSGKFHFIPLSALKGDNVVVKSGNMQWYNGPSLLELLESERGVDKKTILSAIRFSVQGVLRDEINNKNIRGAFGKLLSGVLTKGESVTIIPGRTHTEIKGIFINGNEVDQIEYGQSAIVVLEGDVDFARGSLIVNNEELPLQVNAISTYLCCFEDLVNDPSKRYILRLHSSENTCIVKNIDFKYTNDFSVKNQEVNSLKMNDIALVGLQFSKKISIDSYVQNKFNGRFILIDPVTNSTVGCGIIV